MLRTFGVNLGGGSGGVADAFTIIQPDSGTAPTATGASTLTITSSDASISVIGNSSTDTIDLKIKNAEFDAGNSGTSKTLDFNNGPAQKLTLTGNVTLTLSNPATGAAYLIRLATGSGSFSVTWPGTVKWPGGTTPTITTTASKVDLVNLYWDGTSYYGTIAQNY